MIGLQVSTYLSISKLHCAECSRTVFIPFASIDFSVRGLPSTGPKCHNQLSKERICCHLIGESSQILSIISTAYEGHLWRQAKFQLFIISHPSIRKGFTIHSLWNSVMSADPMKCPLNLVLSDNGAAYKRKFVIWWRCRCWIANSVQTGQSKESLWLRQRVYKWLFQITRLGANAPLFKGPLCLTWWVVWPPNVWVKHKPGKN